MLAKGVGRVGKLATLPRRGPIHILLKQSADGCLDGSQRQPRMLRKAAPPSDPGLRSFLEALADLAANAVLARLHNQLETKDIIEPTEDSPRGFNRSATGGKM
jgi:hypothetical protein